tara:strand:+ start:163 stop:486 length:324 start_codon:yes stop_codon:yes gene_type:complete
MKKYLVGLILISALNIPLLAEVIIDVRTLEEHESGHIKDSLNIEWQLIDSIENTVPKDAKLYLYCRSGNRSGKATKMLISLGYTDVTNLGSIKSASDYLGIEIVKEN